MAGLARALATDEHAAFRLDAAACLETALFGGSPFAAAAALLRAPAVAPRPKQRQDVAGALLLLDVWQSLLRDALLLQTGGAGAQNPEQKKLAARMAATFTTARIQSMIGLLSDGLRRLAQGASGTLTTDAVLAALTEKETERT